MTSNSTRRATGACFSLVLVACGGGGGSSPPPSPPPLVDTTPPDTTLPTCPRALMNQPNASFNFTSTEAGTFEASLDNEAFVVVTSPLYRLNLADGAHTMQIRARDAANNVDASPATCTWTIDTVPPFATITGGPPARGTSKSATITFTTEPGSHVEAYGPTNETKTVTSPWNLTNLADGVNTVSLRAVDAAGNRQEVASEHQWLVDTTAPAATILFPTADSYTDEAQIAVRVSATDADAVASVRVNGVAAVLSDGAWIAQVPVLAGDQDLVVSTTDALGNTTPSAATARLSNRGPVLYDVGPATWDAANNRVLISDGDRGALIALRGSDGQASIVSDATHGTGPALFGGSPLALDAANHRVLTLQDVGILAIDLLTGNRSVVVTSPETNQTHYVTSLACATPCTKLYATALTWDPPSSDAAFFTIDLTTGARTVFSGGDFHIGAGVALKTPSGLVVDNAGGTPRLIASDNFQNAVVAINVTNGDRTVLSSASVGSGTSFLQPNGIALDAANNRVFVADDGYADAPGKLFAVDLANGNRSAIAAPSTGDAFRVIYWPLYDAPNNRVILAQWRPASLSQVDIASGTVSRFYDNFVGGEPGVSGESLALDTQTDPPTLVTTGLRGLMRVHPTNGQREQIVATTYPGGIPFRPYHIQPDSRAGAAPGQILFGNYGANPLSFYRYDPSGSVTRLWSTSFTSEYQLPEFPLDAAGNRLIVSYTQPGVRHVIASIDMTSGALSAPIAETPTTGGAFSHISALAMDAVGGAARLLATDENATLYAFNLANGARTVISSASVGTGPVFASRTDGIAVDVTARAAYLVSDIGRGVWRVDLLTGNRTLVTGPAQGRGPAIRSYWPHIKADFPRRVAYVTSNGDTILAIDLVTGDRVITSR